MKAILYFSAIFQGAAANVGATVKERRMVEGTGTSADLEAMFKKMEEDTLKLALKMEDLLLPDNKCSTDTIDNCYSANYDGCNSEFPKAECPGGQYTVKACGTGGKCGALFDFSTSRLTMPPTETNRGNAYFSDKAKDGICSSLSAEPYMIQASEDSTEYWSRYNVFPPRSYYASDAGVFRIYPGNMKTCPNGVDNYDPRIRPWYVAASSGPKDVVIILDTSGSMAQRGRMDLMRDAAKRVVNTLGVSDYFSIIEFNDDSAHIYGGADGLKMLLRATDKNKKDALDGIDGLRPAGSTNFGAGFELAFQTLRSSFSKEISSNCHRAILFLTDGILTETLYSKERLFNTIDNEQQKYTDNNLSPPVIFTYSFGSGADDQVPKQIACKYSGIWSGIDDGDDLSSAMGAYYKYFAYGLGDEKNEDFVAWVAPYEFASGNGMGITASSPVYDRSVSPPVLTGVAAMDFSFSAMEKALGEEGEASKNNIIDQIVARSVAYCPRLNVTNCQLESLRFYGQSDTFFANESRCGTCDSEELKPVDSMVCTDRGVFYPSSLFGNELNKGRPYETRSCCSIGEAPREAGALSEKEIESLQCKESSKTLMIVGIVVAVVVVSIFVCVFVFYCKQAKRGRPNNSPTQGFIVETPIATPVQATPITTVDTFGPEFTIMPAPTAPRY